MNVMIDIETLGNVPGSAILSIGAYCIETEETFYREIELASCFEAKLSVDADTISWWFKQGEKAKELFNSQEAIPLGTALENLSTFLGKYKPLKVYGNGSSFDMTLLEVAYRRVKKKCPWGYMNIRDLRTVCDFYPEIKRPKNDLKHNSLTDAIAQGKQLKEILEKHRGRISGI